MFLAVKILFRIKDKYKFECLRFGILKANKSLSHAQIGLLYKLNSKFQTNITCFKKESPGWGEEGRRKDKIFF